MRTHAATGLRLIVMALMLMVLVGGLGLGFITGKPMVGLLYCAVIAPVFYLLFRTVRMDLRPSGDAGETQEER
jgi:hypothetical protein